LRAFDLGRTQKHKRNKFTVFLIITMSEKTSHNTTPTGKQRNPADGEQNRHSPRLVEKNKKRQQAAIDESDVTTSAKHPPALRRCFQKTKDSSIISAG
jgi:hypothetical protein